MSSLPKLLERLGELKQIPDAAVSCKDFQAPSEHDFGILRSLFSIKRDATALSSREEDRQFFSAFTETVSRSEEPVGSRSTAVRVQCLDTTLDISTGRNLLGLRGTNRS